MKKSGNAIVFFVCILALVIAIFVFMICIYFSQIGSLLYNIKLDMYSINKSAVISINKGITSRGEQISFNKADYEKYFKEMIAKNYKLDSSLSNKSGLIEKVDIIEYNIYKKGIKDNYTKKRLVDDTIHSVIKVHVKPVIFHDLLKNTFIFEIHEDTALNKVII